MTDYLLLVSESLIKLVAFRLNWTEEGRRRLCSKRGEVAGGRVDLFSGGRGAEETSSRRAIGTDAKTESGRQGGPVVRSSGRAQQPPPVPKRRWVPPSFLNHNNVPDDEKHDIIFRKVRGILNKLTPEKFEKLSDDLLGLDLESPTVLKGVILLIFEKALDEPKYSSMYAQLCRRLSEEAPNFEPPEQACTFRLLLVNKCRDEFENRANAVNNRQEDDERLHLAKRKMLGNIKFIGELGKLNILHGNILHLCIQELISRKHCDEDLECLSQLVRTCGRILDTESGRKLMDQYFARMEHISQNRDLQPRIRFMLRDVIELRNNGWVPRAATAGEGPVPMGQLRDAHSPPRLAPPTQTDPLFRRNRIDHMLAGLTLSPAPTGNLVPPVVMGHPGQNREGFKRGYYNKNNNFNKNQQQQNNNNTAPRFNKARISVGAVDEVQMRPAANSLLFTAKQHRSVAPPLQVQPTSTSTNLLSSRVFEPPKVEKPAPPAPAQPTNNKKNKGPSKDEVIKQVLAIFRSPSTPSGDEDSHTPKENGTSETNGASPTPPANAHSAIKLLPNEMLERLKELSPPEKFYKDIFAALFNAALEHDDIDENEMSVVWSMWRGRSNCDALKNLITKRDDKMAALLARLVQHKVLSLSELNSPCESHEELMLDVLEKLKDFIGIEELTKLFNESKIRISSHVLKGEAASALEKRGLGSLQPALALNHALKNSPKDPKALYRWIVQHVSQESRNSASFAEALVGAILNQGHSDSDCEAAKESLRTFGTLLSQLLQMPSQQLAAVYAAQLYCHNIHYPKGVLLKLFMELYDMEVCERSAFMAWQEDVDDSYPPKGQALFQVNMWLNWLESQVSSEEEG